MNHNRHKWVFYWPVFVFLFSGISGYSLAHDVTPQPTVQPAYQILLLHSYSKGTIWAEDITSGVQAVFPPDDLDAEIYVEYMDTKRIADDTHFQNLFQLYAHKFSPDDFDIIITADDDALNFALQYRETLFPGVPIVFCGVNRFSEDLLRDQPAVTGVLEHTDTLKTLNLALTLHPEATNVYIINDRSTTGLSLKQDLEQEQAHLSRPVTITFLDNQTMTELEAILQTLPADSFAYLMTYHHDQAGNTFTTNETVHRFYQALKVPLYATGKEYLSHGIVGGYLNWGYTQGETAAKLARRILDGEDPNTIPIIQQNLTPPLFDYEQVKKWKIPLSRFPAETIFVNRNPSVLEQYQDLIITVGAVIVGLITIIGLLVINILQRRQVQVAQKRSEATLKSIFRAAPVGIGVVHEREFHWMNDQFCTMVGYTPDELSGQNSRLIYTSDAEYARIGHSIYDKTNAEATIETQLKHKDGHLIDVLLSSTAIDSQNLSAGTVFTAQDITKRKEAEQNKLDLAIEKERVDVLRQFIADVSHDFKTPLTVIGTSIYLLQKKLETVVEKHIFQRHLNTLEAQALHLNKMVDDMLRMLQLDALSEFQFEATDLNNLVKNIVDSHQALAAKKQQRLTFIPGDAIPPVQANSEQLYCAITNLIENAVHYTPIQGEITVQIQLNQQHIICEVTDNGVGIAPETLPYVFKRFYRGDQTRNGEQGGTGLGLAITKRIIEIHQGEITIQSEPNKGSSFRILLPLS